MNGLIIGRFQPFHKGHLEIIKKISKENDKVIVGVGSAQKERETNDPLSGGERIEMIQNALENQDINYEIFPVPDIDCYPAWPSYVRSILPSFSKVYANSSVVRKLFWKTSIKTVKVEEINREEYSGTEIRNRIKEGKEWKHLVPKEVAEYLEELDMEERLKPIIGMKEETEKDAAHLLTKKDKTIATAESCTGGLIAHRLTNVPGSSNYFMRGLVTYSNDAKIELLNVDKSVVEKYGAVSEEVALQMAEGVRTKSRTDIGLATTGIAGPSGGSEEKPVGTVYMALSTEEKTEFKLFHFSGNRWDVKKQTSEKALKWVIDLLRD
ncbi:MAG: nicotinamide-nucleotide adenylyltransferase [Thermoplasmatota archaeon]